MLTKEQLHAYHTYFEYDGINLINKITRNSRAMKGVIAGNMGNRGYLVVRLNYKPILVHRIVWEMCNNTSIPSGMQIDHINGIRTDNRIENLRLVTNHENRKNQKLRVDNKSGYNGIGRRKGSWEARIRVNGETLYIGRFKDVEDALLARKNAEIKYGFHPNHGR